MVDIFQTDPTKKFLKILIGIPCYSGKIAVETVMSMMGALRYHSLKHPNHVINYEPRVRNFTTYAAEKICEAAVIGGYDYVMFWGDDMVVHHTCIERLISHDKDIVGCAVFARSEPFALYAFDEKGNNFHVSRLNTGLQKAHGAGTGVMLMKTSIFDGLKQPWWVWPNDGSNDPDKTFLDRVRKEKGIDTWVDTDFVSDHLIFTPRAVNADTHKAWIKSVKESGILDNEEFKKQEGYKKLEALTNG